MASVSDISDVMYGNVIRMFKYIFKNGAEGGETNLVFINIKKHEINGDILIDVDGSWLKTFNIRQFLLQCTDYDKSLRYKIYYGNDDIDASYLYDVKFNRKVPECVLTLLKNKKIDKRYYLRVVVIVAIELLDSFMLKLVDDVKGVAESYENLTVQFDESIFKDNNANQMVAEGFSDVLMYSLNTDFRNMIFETLQVANKEEAAQEITNLCQETTK